ncbi:MAG: class I mannose-6-phosphate isomerase [Planctomycetaceae bacterium]|nr:class I mannose-6-phosphate isomerase [Planctomycetaceae bacterium]
MLYPLQFRPLLKRYLWGGRRLGTVLGKPIGDGSDYAESWEVVDHGADQSIVANGPLAGMALADVVALHGAELFGRHAPQSRFPLLFKYLDCQQNLSVQVHPDDAAAARLDPPDLGKTEAWVILDARPGSRVYAGLRSGVDRARLAREVDRGGVEACLHAFEPQVGDCIFIPAGTVHALGAGLLVAEIQQASDTTYRLFDWNRVGPDGKPRTLHIEQALAAIDYSAGAVAPCRPKPASQPQVERLVECDKFVLDRWRIDGPQRVETDNRFHILSVLAGELTASDQVSTFSLASGQTLLVPASCRDLTVVPQERSEFLDIYLP